MNKKTERAIVAFADALRIRKRRHPPGTAPGTLPPHREPEEPTRVRLVNFDIDHMSEIQVLEPGMFPEMTPERTGWLDIEGHDVALIADLGSRLQVHPLAIEDALHPGQRVKAEDYGESLFLVLDHFAVHEDGSSLEVEQVSLILQPNVVISVRERQSGLFEPIFNRIEKGTKRIRSGGAGYLAYALVDTLVDSVFPVLELIGDRIADIEYSILDDPTPDDLSSLHLIKRDLVMLRKSVWPTSNMLRDQLLTESPLMGEETQTYLRDAADHATAAVEIIETYREMVASLNDLYLSTISNRTNEIMKVLTTIATIFIPLSFIAGLYGMNFNSAASPLNMPELNWYWGYPAALAMMAAVAGGLLIFFWRRKWF